MLDVQKSLVELMRRESVNVIRGVVESVCIDVGGFFGRRAPFSRGMIIVGVEVVIELGQRVAVGDHLRTMVVRRGHHVVAVDARIVEHIELRLLEARFERRVIEMQIVGGGGGCKCPQRGGGEKRASEPTTSVG